MVDTNYYFDPKTENIDQYNTRIQEYNASKGTINSSSLSPQDPINFISPKETPVYNVAGLTSQFDQTQKLAPVEQKASDLSSRIQQLNNQLVGQAADTAAQNKTEGLTGLNASYNDLNARLTGLKNESLAIPLQLQSQYEGRGATVGGIKPFETGALRNNAIQSLSIFSQMEATQGRITNAKAAVADAISQKYDPIKEQIAAATANLKLITESPEYSLTDKKRAFDQLQIQNTLNQENEKAKLNAKETQDLALKIIAANPNLDATILEALRDAGNPYQVSLIAQKAGLRFEPQDLPASAQEYQFAVDNGYTGSFESYQNEDANRKRSIAAAGIVNDSGLNSKQVTIFNGIVDKYNKSPLVAANDRARILKDVTDAVAADPTNAALQVSFIYSMIQALDTYQSAVREGEIGLLSSTQGLGDKLQNLPTKIQNGTPLSKDKIAEYVAVSKLLTGSISSAAAQKQAAFSAQANVAGIGPAFTDYTTAINGGGPPQKDPLGIGTTSSADNPLGI